MEFRGVVHDTTEAPVPVSVEDEPFLLRGSEEAEFSALEEQVIDLARRERLGSLEAPGRIERFLTFVFGLNIGGRALADERLEALRRAVVVTRHRHHMPDAQAVELRTVGFSLPQIRLVELRAIAA